MRAEQGLIPEREPEKRQLQRGMEVCKSESGTGQYSNVRPAGCGKPTLLKATMRSRWLTGWLASPRDADPGRLPGEIPPQVLRGFAEEVCHLAFARTVPMSCTMVAR